MDVPHKLVAIVIEACMNNEFILDPIILVKDVTLLLRSVLAGTELKLATM